MTNPPAYSVERVKNELIAIFGENNISLGTTEKNSFIGIDLTKIYITGSDVEAILESNPKLKNIIIQEEEKYYVNYSTMKTGTMDYSIMNTYLETAADKYRVAKELSSLGVTINDIYVDNSNNDIFILLDKLKGIDTVKFNSEKGTNLSVWNGKLKIQADREGDGDHAHIAAKIKNSIQR